MSPSYGKTTVSYKTYLIYLMQTICDKHLTDVQNKHNDLAIIRLCNQITLRIDFKMDLQLCKN